MTDAEMLATFYDAESADAPELAADVPFLLAHLPADAERVLEVGVGTGRAAAELLAAGRAVTGIDDDPAVLALARENLGDAVELREQDAADPGGIAGEFDAAVLLFNTFLHFATPARQDALLANLRRCLRPGGVLWIDTQNPDLALTLEADGDGVDELHPVLFEAGGRTVQRTTSVRGDLVRQVQSVRFTYRWFDDGQEREAVREFEAGWTMPRELLRLLAGGGFEVRGLWGDHDGGGVAADSPRLIVCAVRSGDE